MPVGIALRAILGSGLAAPEAPFLNAVDPVSTTEIYLTFSATDPSPGDTLNIYRSTDNITFNLVDTISASSVNYLDSGLAVETTYYYYLTHSNSGGESDPSGTGSATTGPAAPSGLTATQI